MPCVIGQHSPRIEGPWCKRHGPCVVAFPRGRSLRRPPGSSAGCGESEACSCPFGTF